MIDLQLGESQSNGAAEEAGVRGDSEVREEEEAIEKEELEEEDNLLNLLFNQKIHRMEVSIIIDRPRMVQ